MENNELQKIWKSMDGEINQRSKDELNLLLRSKAKQTIRKFLFIIITSVFVSIGLIIWLTITSMNRKEDVIYLINNAAIGIIAFIACLSGVISWYKLQNHTYNQPVKSWVEERITFLSKNAAGRFKNLTIFLVPLYCIMITLSIHVYYEYKPFVEVLKTEESIVGLIVGIPIGLFVAFYVMKKIRKYTLTNLEFLKDIHGRLCNVR